MKKILLLAVSLASIANADDLPRPTPTVRSQKRSKAVPEIRIGQPQTSECELKRGNAREKTLDGRQIAALMAVQRHLLDEGFRHFADGSASECLRSLDGYVFHLIPGTTIGVVVVESGACRKEDFRRTDSQILYEWSGMEPLNVVFGEPGATRAEELTRKAAAASAECSATQQRRP